MIRIKQGDAYDVRITLTDEDGTTITDEMVSTVEISLDGIRKTFPGEITFDSETSVFKFPLAQGETQSLRGLKLFEARVKFPSGEVVGASLGVVDIQAALSREVL